MTGCRQCGSKAWSWSQVLLPQLSASEGTKGRPQMAAVHVGGPVSPLPLWPRSCLRSTPWCPLLTTGKATWTSSTARMEKKLGGRDHLGKRQHEPLLPTPHLPSLLPTFLSAHSCAECWNAVRAKQTWSRLRDAHSHTLNGRSHTHTWLSPEQLGFASTDPLCAIFPQTV